MEPAVDRVLEWKPPHAKWFLGGKLNASVNCSTAYPPARAPRGADLGGEPRVKFGASRMGAARRRKQFANVLKGLASGAATASRSISDVPEVAVAMLACARIGAVHTVVFGASPPSRCATGSMTPARRC